MTRRAPVVIDAEVNQAPISSAPVRKVRGKGKKPTKLLITIRLDRDLVEHFKRRGPGWQHRINSALRGAATMGGMGANMVHRP